jgi:hypothetical protein
MASTTPLAWGLDDSSMTTVAGLRDGAGHWATSARKMSRVGRALEIFHTSGITVPSRRAGDGIVMR